MNRIKMHFIRTMAFTIFFSLVWAGSLSAQSTIPPEKTVRVFYIHPNDVPLDSAFLKGIAKVMYSSQKYFLEQCKFTFKLNNPVCEIIKGTHPRSYYENTPNDPDRYWWAVFNAREDLLNQVSSIRNDGNRSKWKVVFYIDAEGSGAGGGGGGGWVLLPKHDADGARGYPKDTARWCGGMCHELGHCFGLPDSRSTDGTVMSASFYGWPNCIFSTNHINTMKNSGANSGFWTDVITSTVPGYYSMTTPESWAPVINGNKLQVEFKADQPISAVIGVFDLSGKQLAAFKPSYSSNGINRFSFDMSRFGSGNYICSLEKNGKTESKPIVKNAR